MVATPHHYLPTLIVWCMKLKPKMLMKILIRIRKCSILVIIQLILKFYDDSNRVVVAKMKDEIAGVAIKKFVVFKAKMYSFLVDYNSERKKQSLIFSLIRTAF